jgi:hypothetical protein
LFWYFQSGLFDLGCLSAQSLESSTVALS